MPTEKAKLSDVLKWVKEDPTRINELVDYFNTESKSSLKIRSGSLDAVDISHLAQALAAQTSKVDAILLDLGMLHNEVVKPLSSILGSSSKVKKITILDPVPAKIGDLIEILELNPNITDLHIHGPLSSPNLEALIELIKKSKILHTLVLTNNNFNLIDSTKLLTSLKTHPSLKWLIYCSNAVPFEVLSDLLKSNTVLSALSLGSVPISKENILSLIKGLSLNSTLEILRITSEPISNEVIKILASYLENNPMNLVGVILNDIKIRDEGAVHLMRALGKNSVLTTLDLQNINPNEKRTANIVTKTTLSTLTAFWKDRSGYIYKKIQDAGAFHLIPNISNIIMDYLDQKKASTSREILNSDRLPQIPFIPISRWEALTHRSASMFKNFTHKLRLTPVVAQTLPLDTTLVIPAQTVTRVPNPDISSNNGPARKEPDSQEVGQRDKTSKIRYLTPKGVT